MYKILSTKVSGEHLQTLVEYTFNDGSKQEIDVAHFQPKDKEQVIQDIKNRLVSEQRKVDAEKKNLMIKVDIDKDIAQIGE